MREGEPKFEEFGVDKLVGGTPEEERFRTEFLLEKGKRWFVDAEISKTPEQSETIGTVLEKMPEFIKRYGGKPADIKPENIHIVDPDKLDGQTRSVINSLGGAFYSYRQKFIAVRSPEDNTAFSRRLTHEALHFNCFQSFRKKENGNIGFLVSRRAGLQMFSDDEKWVYLRSLDEAVITELTTRFEKEFILPEPQFAGLYADYRDDSNKKDGLALRKIVKDIFTAHEGQFKTEEEVFNVFAKGAMSGKVLEIARLYNETYGKNSFKSYAEKTKESLN